MIPGEVRVSPFFTEGMAVFTTGDESYAERRTGIRDMFDRLALVAHTANRNASAEQAPSAIGLKVAYQTPEEAADLANSIREFFPELRIILVVREDLVAQQGSLMLAQQTGKWHAWKGDKDAQAKKTLSIPLESFHSYADDIRRGMSLLEDLATTHPVLRFSYEQDICAQPDYEKLYRFLGIEELPPEWVRMKKAAPPPQSFIENYDELRTALSELPPIDQAEQDRFATARREDWLKRQRPYFHISRANEMLLDGQHARAIEVCVSTLMTLENLRPVHVERLFTTLTTAGQESRDLEAINKAIESVSQTYSDNEGLHVLIAKRDMAVGDTAGACQRMSAALEAHPDWARLQACYKDARTDA